MYSKQAFIIWTPIGIDISLFIGSFVETRNYSILSLAFINQFVLGSLKRIKYSRLYSLANTLLLNVSLLLQELTFIFYCDRKGKNNKPLYSSYAGVILMLQLQMLLQLQLSIIV